MNNSVSNIIEKEYLSKEDIVLLLNSEGHDKKRLFDHAFKVKNKNIGNKVYLRGLIEYSNICAKDCLYCGIRKSNKTTCRYSLVDEDIVRACDFAVKQKLGSIVIQSGEIKTEYFTDTITKYIQLIKSYDKNLRITLSCGEQSPEVYKKWYEAGAERYLLRIETSNPDLYYELHPNDNNHNFFERIKCLKILREIGYQTGTGVMIGFPFQTVEDLAEDIMFMREINIDMCGMGPYVEHPDTPLYKFNPYLQSLESRYHMTLKMIAVLRIVMKDINIASTTALQTIHPNGKRNALEIGANVIMSNITPVKYKAQYKLYNDKPGSDLSVSNELDYALEHISKAGGIPALGEYGDALHYLNR